MQNLTRLSDEHLIAAYAKGNNQAFDTLLHRHKDKLFAYILHIVKSPELADDIFQETFVKIISTIQQGRYAEAGKFAAWMTRIARNIIIDHFRQNKTQTLVSIDNDEIDVLNRKDLADNNIEDFMVESQILEDVRDLVRELPEAQRQVIEMRFYRNMSFKEIADTTNVSINTALGRMRYALLHLRKLAKEKNIVLSL
ncbi:MAG: sigma-70 family RNA polymerase sigma factor [Bacteroidales bacterium]|nr:sigma-70 family RNA polymerase sigma factor [Bacteroidales bacterium]MBD5246167.1 sigma-70 family RNA polymerase sigma factor [Barnesiella sp.]